MDFYTYQSQPNYGSFVEIHHCFSSAAPNGSNTYQTTPCSLPGTPASLGWMATTPIGNFTTPLYLCVLVSAQEHLLTTNAAECAAVSGLLVGAGPWGYVLR